MSYPIFLGLATMFGGRPRRGLGLAIMAGSRLGVPPNMVARPTLLGPGLTWINLEKFKKNI